MVMNGDYYTEEDAIVRHQLPPRRGEESFNVSEVRIVTPADPEKLAAVRAHRKNIEKRRSQAGLERNRSTVWNTKG